MENKIYGPELRTKGTQHVEKPCVHELKTSFPDPSSRVPNFAKTLCIEAKIELSGPQENDRWSSKLYKKALRT